MHWPSVAVPPGGPRCPWTEASPASAVALYPPRPASLPGHYPGYMPEMPQTLTAALHQEEDWYVAVCLEVDVASQGHTIDEALANLAEAVELYLEEIDDPAGHITSTPLVTSFHLPAA